jgi:type IV pilus assembly protein PilW
MTRAQLPHARSPRQRGFSLVEMMIAMLIGLILAAGIIQIFISSKQSYRVQDNMGRMQENARFAMDFLSQEVRMAGFTGCYKNSPSTIENMLNTPNDYDWNIDNMLGGNESTGAGSWSPALDASVAGMVNDGTDVITIRHMSDQAIDLVSPYNDSAQLFVDDYTGINIGDILMVTDCSQGSIFQATNIAFNNGTHQYDVVHSNAGPYTPGNATPLMANSYGPGSEIAKLVSSVFFIGTNADGVPALYERSLQLVGNASTMVNQEMVDDVEDMQILYGEDTDGNGTANVYVTADAVGNMDNVVSVRVSLLMRTPDDHLVPTKQVYTYNGAVTTAPDYRIRRVFNSTIKLRNRGVL